jgi:hypothetical protein
MWCPRCQTKNTVGQYFHGNSRFLFLPSILLATTRLQMQSDLRTQCTETVYTDFQWLLGTSQVYWRTGTHRLCQFADECTAQRNYSTSVFHPCKRNCRLKISHAAAIRCHRSNFTLNSHGTQDAKIKRYTLRTSQISASGHSSCHKVQISQWIWLPSSKDILSC